jgi:crotonobetainyl-CoA:carnitine CoA-transferase CaiB-like acyl-CoA transferase
MDWQRTVALMGLPEAAHARFATLAGRLANEDELDALVGRWTAAHAGATVAAGLQGAGVPASLVQSPEERIDNDPNTSAWGLWPAPEHREMGRVRVDGLPVHLSETDWDIPRGAPCLGQDNDFVLGEILGIGTAERATLKAEGVI